LIAHELSERFLKLRISIDTTCIFQISFALCWQQANPAAAPAILARIYKRSHDAVALPFQLKTKENLLAHYKSWEASNKIMQPASISGPSITQTCPVPLKDKPYPQNSPSSNTNTIL